MNLTRRSQGIAGLPPFVVDSGAYPHMTNEPKSFSSYTSWPTDHMIQNVLLANVITKACIKVIESIKCWINNHKYTLGGVLYVPELSSYLYSVKQHCQLQGQIIYFKQDKAVLPFPTFVHSVPIKDEIFLNVNLKEPN